MIENLRYSKSMSHLKNFLYSLNTRYFLFVDLLYYVTNLLKIGQAVLEQTGMVLEQTSLVLDSLAVSRFDHAWPVL
jgi:hypothetical protein